MVAGFPPKTLSDPLATVQSEGLRASRVIQKEGGAGLKMPAKPTEPLSENNYPDDVTAKTLYDSVKSEKIEVDASKPTTKIQLVFIYGWKEALTVNLSTTVLELYAHVRALSDFVQFLQNDSNLIAIFEHVLMFAESLELEVGLV